MFIFSPTTLSRFNIEIPKYQVSEIKHKAHYGRLTQSECHLIKLENPSSLDTSPKPIYNQYLMTDDEIWFWSPGNEKPTKLQFIDQAAHEKFKLEFIKFDKTRDASEKDLDLITLCTGHIQTPQKTIDTKTTMVFVNGNSPTSSCYSTDVQEVRMKLIKEWQDNLKGSNSEDEKRCLRLIHKLETQLKTAHLEVFPSISMTDITTKIAQHGITALSGGNKTDIVFLVSEQTKILFFVDKQKRTTREAIKEFHLNPQEFEKMAYLLNFQKRKENAVGQVMSIREIACMEVLTGLEISRINKPEETLKRYKIEIDKVLNNNPTNTSLSSHSPSIPNLSNSSLSNHSPSNPSLSYNSPPQNLAVSLANNRSGLFFNSTNQQIPNINENKNNPLLNGDPSVRGALSFASPSQQNEKANENQDNAPSNGDPSVRGALSFASTAQQNEKSNENHDNTPSNKTEKDSSDDEPSSRSGLIM